MEQNRASGSTKIRVSVQTLNNNRSVCIPSPVPAVYSRTAVYPLILIAVFLSYGNLLPRFFFSDDFSFLYRVAGGIDYFYVFIERYFNDFFYRPLSIDISFRTGYVLFGLNPAGYRLIILVLLSLTGILVYEIVSLVSGRKEVGLPAALFFLTREAHTSAVFWLSAGFQQMEATLFMLGTLYFYLRFAITHRRSLYVAALTCTFLGMLSRESAAVLPLLIISLEYVRGKSVRSLFSMAVILRVVPFCMAAVVPLSRLLFETGLSMNKDTFYTSVISPSVLLKNMSFFVSKSFNTSFEMYILLAWGFFFCLRRERLRLCLAGICLFLLGILTHIYISGKMYPYYICFSLIGPAMVFSGGLLSLQRQSQLIKTTAVLLLTALFFVSFSIARRSPESCEAFRKQERLSRRTVSYFLERFPKLPDKSIVYIQNSTADLWWITGRGKALKLYYNDSIATVFEGLTNNDEIPRTCSGIYLFDYKGKKLAFLRFIDGLNLNTFLKQREAFM